jgi:hypothetical protein
LSQLLPYLAEIQNRIFFLKKLHSQLKDLPQIDSITLQGDGIAICIDQNLIPFNLDQEMTILIKDAIEHWENHSKNLEELSNL